MTLKHKFLSTLISFTLIFSISSTTFAATTATSSAPNIVGKAAISIDAETGEVIYSKNPDNKIYPASTTKLLTALLLTKNKKPSDILTYSNSAKEQPEFSLNKNIHPIKVGEKISADNVMQGLLIYSGNDMAYVIASNILGKINDSTNETKNSFSSIMNKEVQALGLKNTHFITPNGLHDDNHYSTPYDMSKLAKTAFENKWIYDTISKQKSTVYTEDKVKFPITNTNKIIDPKEPVYDKTCIGGKTGSTSNAGKCLIALYNRNGRKIIGVVMKSVYDSKDIQVFKDMENLINYSYENLPTTLHKKSTPYSTIKVSYKPFKFWGPEKSANINLFLDKDIVYYKNQLNDTEKSITQNISNINPWKLNSNNPVGTVTFTERGITKTYKLYPSISTKDLLGANKLLYGLTFIGIIVVLGVLITLVFKITKRSKSKKSYF